MTPSHPVFGSRNPLARVAPLDPAVRVTVLAVRTWALARGLPVDRDALVTVLSILADDQRRGRRSPACWPAERAVSFVWHDAPRWCATNQVAVTPALLAALRVWWAYLADTDGFTASSAGLPTLEAALAEHTGSRAAVPSNRSARAKPPPVRA